MPKRYPAAVLPLLLAAACADGGRTPVQAAECTTPPPPGLSLSPAFPTVAVGDTVRVRALAFVGCPAVPARFVWSTADSLIASVDASGLVTGRRAGTTTLRARMEQAPSVAQDVAVTVRAR